MNSFSIRAIRNPQFNGFSVHLRVLRVSVSNKVLELFSSLASRNSSVLVTASGLARGLYVAPLSVPSGRLTAGL